MLAFWRALPFVAGLSIMPGLAAAQDDGVAFSVNVTLSPKAVAKLAAKH